MKGQIDEKTLKTIKDAYAGTSIFKWPRPTAKGIDDIVFKAMDRAVVAQLRELVDNAEGGQIPSDLGNMVIWESCVLWPDFNQEEVDELPIGIIFNVVAAIKEKSGFRNITVFGDPTGPDLISTVVHPGQIWVDPTEEDIASAVEKTSGKATIQKVRVGRRVFLARPLTKADVTLARQSPDSETCVCQCAVLYPSDIDWDAMDAGIIDTLAEGIHAISGWNEQILASEI